MARLRNPAALAAVRVRLLAPALVLVVGTGIYAGLYVHRQSVVAVRHREAQPVGGFRIDLPLYTLASWDPSRIAAFSFRLTPVTAATAVTAGFEPAALADSCRVGAITIDSATVTCSYEPAHAPSVHDAVALSVIASG